MNYAELSQAICDYVEAGDASFIAHIPDFVRSTEQKVYNEVNLPATRRNVTGQVTPGNPYLTLPPLYLSTFSIATIHPDTGAYEYLLNKDVNFIRECFPFPAVTGQPTHYAQFDEDTFLLGPTPDNAYDVELHYYAYPESIVDAGTSWLGTNFSNVLLYGSLVEANMYIKGEEDVTATYREQYETALNQLRTLVDGKLRRDAYRSGQERMPVRGTGR